ncbi:hypothetical protein B0H13DRAFT_571279 [Mycena leptocephala]|nr:hypothetical protein B0H13DRAFT_571279 [Mycena leptocephala]
MGRWCRGGAGVRGYRSRCGPDAGSSFLIPNFRDDILPGPLQDTYRYSYCSTHPRAMGHTGNLGASSRAPMASSFRISHAVSPDGANADIAPARRTRSWKSTSLCARSCPFTPASAPGWERAARGWSLVHRSRCSSCSCLSRPPGSLAPHCPPLLPGLD